MNTEPLTHLSYHILVALSDDDRHGYGILKDIEQRAPGESPSTGAMYLALQRMTEDGLIEASPDRPRPGEDGRRKYYRMTEAGRRRAREESSRLLEMVHIARARDLLGGSVG